MSVADALRIPRSHRYTETQSVATPRLLRFGPVLGLRDETYNKVMTAQLRLLKRRGRA